MSHRWPESRGKNTVTLPSIEVIESDSVLICSDVVERAIAVSKTFEERTKVHEASKKQNQALSLDLQADASFCKLLSIELFHPLQSHVTDLFLIVCLVLKLASQDAISASSNLLRTLNIIYKKVTSPATTA